MKTNLLEQQHINHCLNWLDWPQIVEGVSSFVAYERSTFILKDPPRTKSLEEVISYYDQVSIATQWVLKGDAHEIAAQLRSLPRDINFESLLKRLKLHQLLELEELHILALEIELIEKLFPLLLECEFLLSEDWQQSQAKLCRDQLRKVVTKDGDIELNGHPELARLGKQISDLEVRIRDTLNFLKNSKKFQDVIQFEGIDLISDRYVLPIKSDHFKSDFGKILGHSTSGQTLYVEPREVADMCQSRLQLLSEKDELLFKITSKINQEFQKIYLPLIKGRHALVDLDIVLAKAFYSSQYGLNRPEITLDDEWSVYGMFHPLIEKAIPNNFLLESPSKGLVVSGPNTGGKTVTLKTLALISLFPHFGLFVPALEARIPLYKGIFYLSHDNQDITSGLSSFSSEVKCLVNLYQSLAKNNIIFIDEIFNSTSSEEASALAIGMLEVIHKCSNAKVVISTHHQSLKVLLSQSNEYESAHVGFDEENQCPTYKLHFGSPGHSLAFKIFTSLTQNLKEL